MKKEFNDMDLIMAQLNTFMCMWCVMPDTKELQFRCNECEFQCEDGTCSIKKYASNHKYRISSMSR